MDICIKLQLASLSRFATLFFVQLDTMVQYRQRNVDLRLTPQAVPSRSNDVSRLLLTAVLLGGFFGCFAWFLCSDDRMRLLFPIRSNNHLESTMEIEP